MKLKQNTLRILTTSSFVLATTVSAIAIPLSAQAHETNAPEGVISSYANAAGTSGTIFIDCLIRSGY